MGLQSPPLISPCIASSPLPKHYLLLQWKPDLHSKRILGLIHDGYQNMNHKTNHTQNLFGFTKLEKTPEIEYLLYDKYFYPLIKTLIKNTGPLENSWKRLHPCRRKLRNYDPSKPSAFKTATQKSKKTKRNSMNPCCLSTARRSAKVFNPRSAYWIPHCQRINSKSTLSSWSWPTTLYCAVPTRD